MLYGTDLEKAVNAKQALEQRNSQQNNERASKREQLKELIRIRQKEVEDLKNRNAVMRYFYFF